MNRANNVNRAYYAFFAKREKSCFCSTNFSFLLAVSQFFFHFIIVPQRVYAQKKNQKILTSFYSIFLWHKMRVFALHKICTSYTICTVHTVCKICVFWSILPSSFLSLNNPQLAPKTFVLLNFPQ